jgi:hypothetical protein
MYLFIFLMTRIIAAACILAIASVALAEIKSDRNGIF